MSARKPVWVDCDPGHDDAMAIILAGWNPHIELLGVSTVAGNQTLEKVTRNALDILDFAGLSHIDVVAGQSKPLVRSAAILCPEIHGDSGLDGPEGGVLLPSSSRSPLADKACHAMFKAISRKHRQQYHQYHPLDDAPASDDGAESGASTSGRGADGAASKRVLLVCTGALTNAAVLLTVYPEVVPMVEVVLMGGCLGVGNTGPVMEFNIQTDPEAAKVVFEAGVPLTMVPLEVTHTALVTPDVVSRIAVSMPTPFGALIQQLLLFFADTYRTVFRFTDPPLHDPCAVAFVIRPEIFQVEDMRVDIEVASSLSAGQTVCDIWHQSGRPANCRVATAMEVPAFWELMLDALQRANSSLPTHFSAA